jgi:hypothetical protein
MVLKLFKEHGLFLTILLSCVILRFLPLFEYQFTLDELSGLNRTRFDSFSDLIEKGVKIDMHPALIQLFIFGISKIFGYHNWIVKLPFLLMSVGGIIYAYVFSIRNFSKQSGIFAALIFSFSLIFVFYAPIARMYTAGVFFSIAMLYYFFEIFFNAQNNIRHYVYLGLFALLSAMNHHMNALFAFTLCASGVFFLNSSNRKKYLLTCCLVTVCYLPNLPTTLYQLSLGGIGIGGNGWLPVPKANVFLTCLKILLGTGKSFIIFLLVIVIALFLKRSIHITKKQFFLLSIYLLNFLIIYFYSVYRAPIYQHSVMLFSAVAFVLFVASLIGFKSNLFFYPCVVMVASVLVFKTYFKKDYFNQSVKTVFEYQFQRTLDYKKKYGDKNVYPIFCDADEFMEQIYFQKYKSSFECKISSDSLTYTTRLFSRFVANLNCDYLVLSSSFPAQQAIVAQHFPFLIENTQTQAINLKVYSKKLSDKALIVPDDRVFFYSNNIHPGAFKYRETSIKNKNNRNLYWPVDSLNEFPFDAKTNYFSVVKTEGEMMLVKSIFKLNRSGLSGIETCISVANGESKKIITYDSKDVSDFVLNSDSTACVYVNSFFGTEHSNTDRDAELSAYIWNRKNNQFILTDFQISIIDFCPRKWQLWD